MHGLGATLPFHEVKDWNANEAVIVFLGDLPGVVLHVEIDT
jgi:hypothetical protein